MDKRKKIGGSRRCKDCGQWMAQLKSVRHKCKRDIKAASQTFESVNFPEDHEETSK